MITCRPSTFLEIASLTAAAGVVLPIEQTEAFAAYEATMEGRKPWAQLVLEEDGAPVACVAFTCYTTHGYRYLRAHHAPVWLKEPTPRDEAAALDALISYVKTADKRIAFMRLCVAAELSQTRPVLSSIPYDTTVHIDISSGDVETIISNMKPRGRRDVRKSLRQTPATHSDETLAAAADFAPYYAVMQDTAARDGFHPAPAREYQEFLRLLGPGAARLYAARVDGEVVAWAIDTISGTRATHYFAASTTASMRMRVNEPLLMFECEDLAKRGCTVMDMMAVGSDFSPTLLGLNTYKCKLGETVAVAPDRDVPIKLGFYSNLWRVRTARDFLRARKAGNKTAESKEVEGSKQASTAPEGSSKKQGKPAGDTGSLAAEHNAQVTVEGVNNPQVPVETSTQTAGGGTSATEAAATPAAQKPRGAQATTKQPALIPLIVGGDIGVYALGREFHEAFGVVSHCIAPAPIAAIGDSKIFTHTHVEKLDAPCVSAAVTAIAAQNPSVTHVLIANTDASITVLAQLAPTLPANVVVAAPTLEAVATISNKSTFAKLCKAHGLAHPTTVALDFATLGEAPEDLAAATQKAASVGYPLVAKPQESSVWQAWLAKGFKKVYFVEDEPTLKELIGTLSEAGFEGEFLFQQLIPGDDTCMHSVTLYMAAGEQGPVATLEASAHVLLEDHAPSMLGNPVAMVTQDAGELYGKLEALLASCNYHGFANFDLKQDPRDGTRYVLECNPRIGRNSYYVAAAGVNPMQVLVEDVVEHRPQPCRRARGKVLYTLVPPSMLMRYIRESQLAFAVARLIRAGKVVDPQRYRKDNGFKRRLVVEATRRNQVRKFNRYYPKPTDTSF